MALGIQGQPGRLPLGLACPLGPQAGHLLGEASALCRESSQLLRQEGGRAGLSPAAVKTHVPLGPATPHPPRGV